jgi:hypothetical protein
VSSPHTQDVVYETVWTGAMETAAVRAQQSLPPRGPQERRALRRQDADIILAYLRRHPWSTMREIHTATGVCMPTVNGTLDLGADRGSIERSHRQQEDRNRPVRWRVVA